MMAGNASGSNTRSRRSACDRCRAYKLRCQRDELPNEPCDRCSKAHLVCTTTLDQTPQRPSRGGHPQNGAERGGRTDNNTTTSRGARLPSRERSNSPPGQSNGRRDSGYGSRLPSVILPSPVQREYTRDTVASSALQEIQRSAAAWPAVSTARRSAEETGDVVPLDQEPLVCALIVAIPIRLALS